MDQGKKTILVIIIIASFVILAFNIFPFFGLSEHTDECSLTDGCPHEKQLNLLEVALPILVALSLLVGAGTYYLMSEKIESKQAILENTAVVILKFLSVDERKLVNLLMENNGKILQAEVTHLPGMTKIKSHRVTQKLIDKGVIEKESVGKTNRIQFTKEIREGLL